MNSLVFSNMLHRPVRTIVSVLGIAVGVLLILFTIGLTNGTIREQAMRETNVGAEIFFRGPGTLGISGAESFRLSSSVVEEIKSVNGIERAVGLGQNSIETTDNNTGKRLIDGVNFEEYSAISGLQIIEGRPFSDGADEAIIDTAWKKQKGLKVGETVPIYERPFTVVGIYEPAAGSRIKIPLSTMQRQLETQGRLSSVLVKIAPGHTVEEVGTALQERFPENQVISTEQLEELYMAGFPAMNVFLDVFIGIAAVISALVILLTMYTTVTERTRQIGIMKSLGMSSPTIAWTLARESLLISFFGIIGGILLTIVLQAVLKATLDLEVEMSGRTIGLTFIVGLIGGLIGSLYPALRAAHLDAVEALSYE